MTSRMRRIARDLLPPIVTRTLAGRTPGALRFVDGYDTWGEAKTVAKSVASFLATEQNQFDLVFIDPVGTGFSRALQEPGADKKAESGKDKSGEPLGKYYLHSLGHHVGLDVHDPTDPEFDELKLLWPTRLCAKICRRESCS